MVLKYMTFAHYFLMAYIFFYWWSISTYIWIKNNIITRKRVAENVNNFFYDICVVAYVTWRSAFLYKCNTHIEYRETKKKIDLFRFPVYILHLATIITSSVPFIIYYSIITKYYIHYRRKRGGDYDVYVFIKLACRSWHYSAQQTCILVKIILFYRTDGRFLS